MCYFEEVFLLFLKFSKGRKRNFSVCKSDHRKVKMGAGASVENPELTPEAAAEATKAVNKRTEQVISAAESVEKNAGKAADSIAKAAENDVPQAVEDVVAETPEEIAAQIEAVLAKIPDEEIAGCRCDVPCCRTRYDSRGDEIRPRCNK